MGNNKIRSKADVQLDYHQGHRQGAAMFNIKVYDDCSIAGLTRKFKGVTGKVTNRHSPQFEQDYFVHEYGDPATEPVWEWLDNIEGSDLEDRAVNAAWEMACEEQYEQCKEDLLELFPGGVQIWSTGRSGGWLTVEGLPHPEEWDAIMLGMWRKAGKWVDEYLDDIPYKVLWHLAVNVHEGLVERMVAAL